MYELTPQKKKTVRSMLDQVQHVPFIEWVCALGKFVDLDRYTVQEVEEWYDRAVNSGSGHIDPHGKTVLRFVGVG